jgi:hypothetical protein
MQSHMGVAPIADLYWSCALQNAHDQYRSANAAKHMQDCIDNSP